MELNRLGDEIAGAIGSWFGSSAPQEEDGKGKKKQKTSGGDVSPKRPRGSPSQPGPCPFGSEQAEWLQDALAATMTASFETFGKAVNRQMAEVKHKTDATEVRVTQAEKTIAEMQQSLEEFRKNSEEQQLAHEKAVTDLTQQLANAAISPGIAPASSPETSPRSTASTSTTPPQRRAYLGGLGWNASSATLEERYKQVLQRANIDESMVEAAAPVTNRADQGSAMDIMFVTADALQTAQIKIRSARITFEGGKTAWMEASKSDSDRRIHRQLREIKKGLEELEQSKDENDRQTYVIRRVSQEVWSGDVKTATLVKNSVKWAAAVKRRFSDDQLKQVSDVVEDR